MKVDFDKTKNQMSVVIPEGVGAKFQGSADVYEKSDTQEENKVDVLTFSGDLKSASFTNDLGFMKPMLEKHIEYLRKMFLPIESRDQLAFQIVDHSILLDLNTIAFKSDKIKLDEANTNNLKDFIQKKVQEVGKSRIDLVNDPKEIIEDLELENFSVNHLEASFHQLMEKLQFKLPKRLITPTAFFLASNYLANKITVNDKNLVFSFDPKALGLMSKKNQHLLQDIKHPTEELGEQEVGYSVTLDQNILNSMLIEMSTTKQQISLRNLASMFDKNARYIKMANTKLLTFTMPGVRRDYGGNHQFDIVGTLDQEVFHKNKKKALSNGFTINQDGGFICTFNFVSYLKVRAEADKREMQYAKLEKAYENALNGIETEDDEEEEEIDLDAVGALIDSTDWPTARTIYGTMTLKGKIAINKIGDKDSMLSMVTDSILLSKLDIHEGVPQDKTADNAEAEADNEDDDGDDSDDDEEDDDDTRTAEGGIIQALFNMQLQPIAKNYIPEVKQVFSRDVGAHSSLDCYGMHLLVPDLTYFQGGFELKGNFNTVPVNDEACIEISTDGLDFMGKFFQPEILRVKVQQLDYLYDHVESVNPKFANYFMKPSTIIDSIGTDGFASTFEKFEDKVRFFLSKTPFKDSSSFDLFSKTLKKGLEGQFQYAGGKQVTAEEMQARTEKDEKERIGYGHLENAVNNPMDLLGGIQKMAEKIQQGPNAVLNELKDDLVKKIKESKDTTIEREGELKLEL